MLGTGCLTIGLSLRAMVPMEIGISMTELIVNPPDYLKKKTIKSTEST
jgi:hypothetical protein